MQVFRKVLHAESYCSPLYQLDDQQVLRVLSGLIYARRIILYDFEPRDMAERVSSGGDFSAFVEAKPRQRREPPRIVRQRRRPDQIMADIPVLVPEDIADAKRTWIEIQLIGEDDMPIANANYVLSGPGKHIVIRGTLDSDGLARHEKLMPGNYQVNFPELDKDAWEVV